MQSGRKTQPEDSFEELIIAAGLCESRKTELRLSRAGYRSDRALPQWGQPAYGKTGSGELAQEEAEKLPEWPKGM
jgi:hypothetical protein